ncbi:unnamed protein product [Soboliphyme baturini]|uniref:Uncharacterized protein n=1 Tax=Soboliphyme baturini TaxID=241478 RepID=A0A183IXJ5_9BILA|nr:unnamed protein product [Soboliphyme baturini]
MTLPVRNNALRIETRSRPIRHSVVGDHDRWKAWHYGDSRRRRRSTVQTTKAEQLISLFGLSLVSKRRRHAEV